MPKLIVKDEVNAIYLGPHVALWYVTKSKPLVCIRAYEMKLDYLNLRLSCQNDTVCIAAQCCRTDKCPMVPLILLKQYVLRLWHNMCSRQTAEEAWSPSGGTESYNHASIKCQVVMRSDVFSSILGGRDV
jgi:hypothetical protein